MKKNNGVGRKSNSRNVCF